MKRYKAKFNPNRKGVYAVSLVDEPAMEGNFIQFQKEQSEIKFANVNEDKRRVMGLILEPNKQVLRFDKTNDSYYTVEFGEEDIEDVAYNFQKQGNQNNSTIQHDGINLSGVSFVETWIVENPLIDKSTNFGMEYPKGSWIGVMQLDNKEVWNEYVKTGKVKGFSIDAFMQFEEINLNKVNMSDNNEKDNVLLSAIEKGFTELKDFFKPKKDKKDMTPEELLEEEKKKKEAVKMEAEKPKDEPKKVEFNAEDFVADMVKELQSILEPVNVELTKLKEDLGGFQKENEALKLEVVELGKQPATRSVGTEPKTEVKYSEMSKVQQMEYNQRNRR